MDVDVNYEPDIREASDSGIKGTFFAVIVGFSAIIALILIIIISKLERVERSTESQPAISPATPSMTAPQTPERSSPAVSNEQSPRTPQPFVDYVRRTIDETPYYRRDARRRFNPQNTF